jgi:D-arabinose 1-dehydrogenase-like Zn-dependent alcohol dehydrogenase
MHNHGWSGYNAGLVIAGRHRISGKVKPILDVYPLAQVNEVRARLEAGQVRYRGALTYN